MRVKRLSMLHFRGIERMVLDFGDAQTTVISGANGSGKSAVLDCLAVLLSQFVARVRTATQRGRSFADNDVMSGCRSAVAAVAVESRGGEQVWQRARWHMPPPIGEIVGDIHRNPFMMAGSQRVVEVNSTDPVPVAALAKALRDDLLAERPVDLPVLVHYGVNRGVLDIPLRIRKRHGLSRLDALDGVLEGSPARFRVFFQWFRNQEDLENEQLRETRRLVPDPQLEAVRRAIPAIMDGYSHLRVKRNPLRMVCEKRGVELAVDQLSDGEKGLLALVGDLARRFAIANPHLKDPLRGPGVVLIDEIDLHLHPEWQRQVIPRLESTFPNCQFILTTHSPQVLSTVRPDQNVFLLRETDDGIVAVPVHCYGRDSTTILMDVMGVARRPEPIRGLLEECFGLIDRGYLAKARRMHRDLESRLGPDDPDVIGIELLIRRREALGR